MFDCFTIRDIFKIFPVISGCSFFQLQLNFVIKDFERRVTWIDRRTQRQFLCKWCSIYSTCSLDIILSTRCPSLLPWYVPVTETKFPPVTTLPLLALTKKVTYTWVSVWYQSRRIPLVSSSMRQLSAIWSQFLRCGLERRPVHKLIPTPSTPESCSRSFQQRPMFDFLTFTSIFVERTLKCDWSRSICALNVRCSVNGRPSKV